MPRKFIPTEAQKAFAERVKQRRKELGMSQNDLALEMTKVDKQHREVKVWTVQGYERGHIPRNIQILCEALSVTPDFLLGTTHQGDVDWDKTLIIKNDGRTPLYREELTNYGGLPVWVRPRDERSSEYCALVDDVHYALVSLRHGSVPFSDVEGTVWVEPQYRRDDVLTRDEAESTGRVFIMPIRASIDVKRSYCGWYSYNWDRKMFEAEDAGWVFSANQYGTKYIGFRNAKLTL